MRYSVTRSAAVLLAGLTIAAPLSAQEVPGRRGDSTTRMVLHAVGGALVGGWIGYMASQVQYSDWDRTHDNNFGATRLRYASVGGGAGSLLGLLVGSRGGTRAPMTVAAARPAPVAGGNELLLEEISASPHPNVLEMIRALRPQWLNVRGTQTFRENPRGQSFGGPGDGPGGIVITDPGTGKIKVYYDGALLGEVETLRGIPVANVESVRFLDAARATYAYGQGHSHGVIEVRSR
ncbi:MAG TPA: hypothetical protein VGR37_15585 [Longimicrobiaceae bacterium]|nr:hypothetical protein [Longimicrobiaceae bacterium]